MNDITKKLKETLTEEDQKALETAINSIVEEKVSKDVPLLVEEEKARLEKEYNEKLEKVINEEYEELKTTLNEEYETKVNTLEEQYVEKLDAFLEHEISEQISDEAISKIAINETLAPVVNGIKKVFAENGLELDSEGSALLKEALEEITALKDDVNRLTEENLELNKFLEKMATRDLLGTKTEGMLPEQKERVYNMFEDKSFEEVETKVDEFVDIVLETKIEKETEINELFDIEKEGDGIEPEKKQQKDIVTESVNSILNSL